MVGLPQIKARRKSDPPYIGRYRTLAFLGAGGLGIVYAARASDRIDKLAAIKMVHPHIAGRPGFRPRFEHEIAAIRRVQSPYVPRFVDEGPADEHPWLATELIHGLSLDRIVGSCGPLPEPAVWRLAAGIIEALTTIHDEGLVHRDLKPQNVLVTAEGPRITDFSLMHLTDLPRLPSSRMPIASYQYAAPELALYGLQAAGRPADVFAFGATLLFAATGHPPHDAENREELIYQAQNENPDLAGLPRGIYHLIEQCLYRARDARPLLTELREEFAREVESEDGMFAATLPPAVTGLLKEYRGELAYMARTGRGPAPEADEENADRPPPLSAVAAPDKAGIHAEFSAVPDQETRQAADAADPAEMLFGSSPGGGITALAPEPGSGYNHSSVVWTRSFGSWIRAPVTIGGDIVIVSCLDGTVAALSTADGELLWSRPLGARLYSAALFLTKRRGLLGTAYAGTGDGGVHVIDISAQDHRHRRLFRAGGAIEGTPVADKDWVYILSADGHIYRISVYSPNWDVLFRMDGPAAGALAAADGMVFAAGADGCLYAIDTATRRSRWRLPTDGLLLSAPLPVGGRLYVAGTDGLLREVDIADRRTGAVKIGAPVHVGLVHDQGRLYIGGSDGVVRAYDISHERYDEPIPLWTCSLDDEVSGLAAAHGSVYATAGDRVVEIEVTTRRPHPRFRLGSLTTAAPVISGRSGYVVGLGGLVSRVDLQWVQAGSNPVIAGYAAGGKARRSPEDNDPD